jgi:hypothetical protein
MGRRMGNGVKERERDIEKKTGGRDMDLEG